MKNNTKYLWLIIPIVLVVHLLLLMNLKFTAWPEMTLWPYLMTKGWLPYADIAIAHNPLMIIDLSIFYKLFGTGILQLKIFTWIIIGILDLLVFWVSNKLWNKKVAIIALFSFVLLQLFYEGNGLWFDLYMGIFAFISFYFARSKKWFWTGIFWALAFVSKQTAVWFLIPILLELVQSTEYKVQKFAKFAFSIALVLFCFTLLLFIFNLLPSYYNWAINFGIFILPKAAGQIQLPDIKILVVSIFPFLIFIPLIWKTKGKYLNLLFWSIAGALGAYPRFEYFHFQPALPFIAIAIGLMFLEIKNSRIILKLFLASYCLATLVLLSKFIIRNYHREVRFNETSVQKITKYVINNTEPNDKIFVLNWWDSIYALADRQPAVTPWVPQLSWYMELPGIQENMVENLISSKPKLIIFNPYTESGLSAYIPKKAFGYITSNYKLKEKLEGVEILISK